jgi:hypothetical protein
MTTKPSTPGNQVENEDSITPTAPSQPKRDIYPAVNSRFMGMMLWLGLAFAVAVILIQQFSGYN